MKCFIFFVMICMLASAGYAQKPNVVLIVSDDHGYADMNHLGFFSNLLTPNLDKLADESLKFNNAYATSPICSPSRTGMITGQYQARNGNYFYGGPGIEKGTKTMAQGFQENGYTTAYFGKLHYGKDDSPASYNYPANHGFDDCITAGYGGRVHYLYHNEKAMEKHGKPAEPWMKNGEVFEKDGFSTEMISEWTQSFMEDHQEKPFFVQVAFNAVHNFTFQLPDEYLKKWDLPYYPDYEELGDKMNEDKWYDKSIIPNLPHGREYYIAQLYYLDKEIGKICKKLEELGLEKNTIVVYTSDNGGSNCSGGMNTPLRSTKYSLYEGGIRVPLMIRWPNKLEESSTDMMVSAFDLMPTLLAASGVEATAYKSCDGVNLLPALLGDKALQRDELVWDVGFAWAVRQGNWKLKVVTDQKKADRISKKQHTDLGKGVELFNLKDDIGESNNLADRHLDKIRDLTEVYNNWKNEVNDSSRLMH